MALIANGKIILTTEDNLPSGSGPGPSPFNITASIPLVINNDNISIQYDEHQFQINDGYLDLSDSLKELISNKEDKRFYISGENANLTSLGSLGSNPIIGDGHIFSQFNSFDDFLDFCIDNNLDSIYQIQYNLNGSDQNGFKFLINAVQSDVQAGLTIQVGYQNTMTMGAFNSYGGENGPEYTLPANSTDQGQFSHSTSDRVQIVEEKIQVGTSEIEYRTQYNRVGLSVLSGTISGEVGTYLDYSIVGTDYFTHIEDYQLVLIGTYLCYVASRNSQSFHLLIISKTGADDTKANKIHLGGGGVDLDILETNPTINQIRIEIAAARYNVNAGQLNINSIDFNIEIITPNNSIRLTDGGSSQTIAQFLDGVYVPSDNLPLTFPHCTIARETFNGRPYLLITLNQNYLIDNYLTAGPNRGYVFDSGPTIIQDLIDVKVELEDKINSLPTIKTSLAQISGDDTMKGGATFNTIPIGSNIISITSGHDGTTGLDNDKAPCFCGYEGVNQNGTTTNQIIKARVLLGGNVDMEEQGDFYAIVKYI